MCVSNALKENFKKCKSQSCLSMVRWEIVTFYLKALLFLVTVIDGEITSGGGKGLVNFVSSFLTFS